MPETWPVGLLACWPVKTESKYEACNVYMYCHTFLWMDC